MVKVSIVTISFNQADFLEEAILSVLGQDYPDIEYIIVDAGSTDGSLEIIERYRERLAAVIVGPDAGPADGLNKGFRLATGSICGYINADDAYLPGAISSAVKAFERHPDAGADLCARLHHRRGRHGDPPLCVHKLQRDEVAIRRCGRDAAGHLLPAAGLGRRGRL